MLQHALTRMGLLVACATVVVHPMYSWLERRHRSRWPRVLLLVPAGRGAYRAAPHSLGTVKGQAPLATRLVAFFNVVIAGVCLWDGGRLARWIAAGGSPERAVQPTVVMVVVLGTLAAMLTFSADRLLRRGPELANVGVALSSGTTLLGAFVVFAGSLVLMAGARRLSCDTLEALETLWLPGGLDVAAAEACALLFWVGARRATAVR